MAVSPTHNGWRYDRANARLDFYFRGTRVASMDANGIDTADEITIINNVPQTVGAGSIGTTALAASGVTGAKLATGIYKVELVAGQDETSDTTIPVTGLAAGDELVRVLVEDGTSGVTAQRANDDFTVGASNLTVGANAANNTGKNYIIHWIDHT